MGSWEFVLEHARVFSTTSSFLSEYSGNNIMAVNVLAKNVSGLQGGVAYVFGMEVYTDLISHVKVRPGGYMFIPPGYELLVVEEFTMPYSGIRGDGYEVIRYCEVD